MNISAKPYRLKNTIQYYKWGTSGQNAFIPILTGITPEPEIPFAELWMGAHPKAPSTLIDNYEEIPLDILIEQHPEKILGENNCKKFNSSFPFLFKVLSANEALSIQVHPNKMQAERLHSDDPDHYPDDNHKPEIAIALDSLTALAGFQKFPDIRDMLNKYIEIAAFIGEDIVADSINKYETSKNDRASVKNLFSEMMTKSIENERELDKTIQYLLARFENSDPLSEKEKLFLELFTTYGADVGLLCLFFFNLITLKAGEAFYTDAGIPHAYIKGNIIECMANSDNVVRAGLTPKFKDVKTLLNILTYETGAPDIMNARSEESISIYNTPADEFLVRRIQIRKDQTLNISSSNAPSIFIVLDGIVNCLYGEETKESYTKGESFLTPAILSSYTLCAKKNTVLFEATIPD